MKFSRRLFILLLCLVVLAPSGSGALTWARVAQLRAPLHQTSLGVQAFLDHQPGPLKHYTNNQQDAATIIENNSLYYGVSPHVLLVLLETSGSLLSDPAPPDSVLRQPFGAAGPDGFAAQIEWACQELRAGLGPYDQPLTLTFADGATETLSPSMADEDITVQRFLSLGRTLDEWYALRDRFSLLFRDYFDASLPDLFSAPSLNQPATHAPATLPSTGFLHMPWPAGTNVFHLAYFDHVYPTVDSGGDGNNIVMTYLGEKNVQYNTHDGDDYSFPDQLVGTPILAAAPGVAYARTVRGNGVVILHDNGYETVYWHLNEFDPRFYGVIDRSQGVWVETGDTLGTSGSSGFVVGTPHLHFEVRHNGRQIDPYGWYGVGPDPCAAYAACEAGVWLWHESLRGSYDFTPPDTPQAPDNLVPERDAPPDFLVPGASVSNSGDTGEQVGAAPAAPSDPPDAAMPPMSPPDSSPPPAPQDAPANPDIASAAPDLAPAPTAAPAPALDGASAPQASVPDHPDWQFPPFDTQSDDQTPPVGTLSINPPDDVLLRVLFDGHLMQHVGSGEPAITSAFAFEEGRYGQGLRLPRRSGLTYPLSDNLRLEAGTIGLWAHLPETYPSNSIDRHYLFAASAYPEDLANGIYTGTLALRRDMIGLNNAPRWNFWTTPLAGEAKRHDLAVPDTLDAGWHHFAVTWDARERSKALYIDGLQVAAASGVTLPEDIGTVLQLGRFTYDGTQSGMLLDDLTVFNRVLEDSEILTLAEAPVPLPTSATIVHSSTILVDTNAHDAESTIAAVQMGRNGEFAHPDDYYDAFRWQLAAEEGPHTVEVRYFDQAGNHTHLTQTVLLDLPPRGTATRADVGTLTATLAISATDMQQPISMQVSATPDFADAEWQPLRTSVEWPLQEGELSVYVRFRDAGGQLSEPLHVAAPDSSVYLPLVVSSQPQPVQAQSLTTTTTITTTTITTTTTTTSSRSIYLPLVQR